MKIARVALGLALSLAALGADCNTTPEPNPAPGSWLVLLCKASDVATEPQQPDFYQAVFSRDSADLLWQYFNALSGGSIDVSGSRVRGWFTMPVTAAVLAARNNTTNPNRSQTATDCRNAAIVALTNAGVGVDPAKYSGIISVINTGVDVGAAGFKNVVLSSHLQSDLTFVEHEMLHIYGLGHSWTMARDAAADHIFSGTTDSEYQDCWDMMSAVTCVWTFATPNHGTQGPGLQAAYLRRLGWITAGRVDDPGTAGRNTTVRLAPVSEPNRPGPLFSRIETPNGAYVVEYRVPTGFDRAIPRAAVIIREERGANGRTYLVTRPNGNSDWVTGEAFTDTRNFIRISVDALAPDAATVTINTMFSPGQTPGALNEVCGNTSTNQTRPCASGLRCIRRSSGQIISIDFFCLP
jgi:hypothetical protein